MLSSRPRARLVLIGVFAVIIIGSTRWAYEKVRHREGMGLGDVKMMGMIAAFIGLNPALSMAIACG